MENVENRSTNSVLVYLDWNIIGFLKEGQQPELYGYLNDGRTIGNICIPFSHGHLLELGNTQAQEQEERVNLIRKDFDFLFELTNGIALNPISSEFETLLSPKQNMGLQFGMFLLLQGFQQIAFPEPDRELQRRLRQNLRSCGLDPSQLNNESDARIIQVIEDILSTSGYTEEAEKLIPDESEVLAQLTEAWSKVTDAIEALCEIFPIFGIVLTELSQTPASFVQLFASPINQAMVEAIRSNHPVGQTFNGLNEQGLSTANQLLNVVSSTMADAGIPTQTLSLENNEKYQLFTMYQNLVGLGYHPDKLKKGKYHQRSYMFDGMHCANAATANVYITNDDNHRKLCLAVFHHYGVQTQFGSPRWIVDHRHHYKNSLKTD